MASSVAWRGDDLAEFVKDTAKPTEISIFGVRIFSLPACWKTRAAAQLVAEHFLFARLYAFMFYSDDDIVVLERGKGFTPPWAARGTIANGSDGIALPNATPDEASGPEREAGCRQSSNKRQNHWLFSRQ